MKKLALFLTCAIVVCSMASCLDDDNTQNVLTQEKMNAAVKTMEGTYHGKMVYTSDPRQIPDTIKTLLGQWTLLSPLKTFHEVFSPKV